MEEPVVRVCFVCLGNICRSPTAEGVFRQRVRQAGLEHAIAIDSAGTHGYHIGSAPDPRACEAAARRGVDLTEQKARQATRRDFQTFDYVLAMDRSNLVNLERICPSGYRDRLRLFLDFAENVPVHEVPDPYFGGEHGFEQVLDLVESAADGLLADIRRRYTLD